MLNTPPTPPNFKTKVDVIHDYLRQRILDGRLAPNAKITLRGLAAELRTSAMPVREAVNRLAHEGLIDITPHTGMRVASLSLKEGEEIYSIRSTLEGMAAALAAQIGGSALTQRLLLINQELADAAAAADFLAVASANRRFHMEIAYAAGNSHLTRILEDLLRRSLRFQIGFRLVPASAESSAAEHLEICAAIGAGDPARAELAARRHNDRAAENLPKITQTAL